MELVYTFTAFTVLCNLRLYHSSHLSCHLQLLTLPLPPTTILLPALPPSFISPPPSHLFSLISPPSQTLLSDPWLVISPLLTAVRMSIFSAVCHPSVCPSFTPPLSSSHLSQAPEAAAKLQPVCRALNIDKDDFASKRIMAAYDRISGESGVLTENLYVTGERDCKSVFLCFHRLTYASLLRERDPSRQHNASHREDCARCAFPVFLSLYVSHRG